MHKLSTEYPPHPRRWERRHHFDGWDLLVWIIWVALAALFLLATCGVLWVVTA